ncbi:Uma2 family endonuclease [Chloroflexus aurantiacus]
MSQNTPEPTPQFPHDDPYYYGWRLVRRPTPDDPDNFDQVPLTLEDVLHPEIGDFVVNTAMHFTDRSYLTQVLKARLETTGQAIVFSSLRVVWDVPGLRPHSPDVMVIPGIAKRYEDLNAFDVAKEGHRPALIIEITSPHTREIELVRKVEHYAWAGVQQYVIVDSVSQNEPRQLRLLDYRLVDNQYQLQPPDNLGRVYLEIAHLWLGVKDGRVVCYDDGKGTLPDYTTLVQQLEEAQARRQAAEQARRDAEARRQAAEQARRDAEARAAIEERIRELEEELRRLRREQHPE